MNIFKNIGSVVDYMFTLSDSKKSVSVITHIDMAVKILREFLGHDDVMLDSCEIKSYASEQRYLITLRDGEYTNCWHLKILPIYNHKIGGYYNEIDGFVLFHNSIDDELIATMNKNNQYGPFDYQKFTVDANHFIFDIDEMQQTVNMVYEVDLNDEVPGHKPAADESKDIAKGCNEDGSEDMHGFTVNKSNGDSYCTYSFYTSDKLSPEDIQTILNGVQI